MGSIRVVIGTLETFANCDVINFGKWYIISVSAKIHCMINQ